MVKIIKILEIIYIDISFILFQMKSEHLYHEDVRLISLLSNFLEKTWKEKISTDEDLLTFIITWHPMVNYLQRFRK